MAISVIKYLLFILLAALGINRVTSAASKIQPRMSDGTEVDTLKRFPHHVTIEPMYDDNSQRGPRLCGGSILRENWIVTSSSCVRKSARLNLYMQRLYRNNTKGSFTIEIDNNPSNVIVYPTEYDDIALVKLPIYLGFSRTIKSIAILETPLNQLQNKFVVLPGFDYSAASNHPNCSNNNSPDARTNMLTYAMLSIVSNNICTSTDMSEEFDEYLNVCAKSWDKNENTPCLTDFGNGLVVGWPADPKLVGIYSRSTSNKCNVGDPSVYINIQRYKSWIDRTIANH